MAEITFKCSECGKQVKSDDSLCGENMVCPSCSADIIIPIPGIDSGMELGDFKLIEKLGSGSMGEVWLAYQKTMDRKVALKVLAPKYGSDKKFIDRFMSEIKHSAKLSHPNIVTAFYAGADKGHYYLAISYVIGKTVDDIQAEKGKFTEKEALNIILSIVDALEYAWNEFRILHRDIKPSNIMIDRNGRAMLLDLGIAKSLDEESDLTMTGTVVGTPFYISPEQAMALDDIDFRSDIYSLGTTLYHMVTGRVPYNATTAMAIIMKHINEDFPEPKQFNDNLSDGCVRLIKIMMSKERELRHRSWGELRNDIKLVLDGKMPATARPSDETVAALPADSGTAPGKKSEDEIPDRTDKSSAGDTRATDTSEKETVSASRKNILKIAISAGIALMFLAAGAVLIIYLLFIKPESGEKAQGKSPVVRQPFGTVGPPVSSAARQIQNKESFPYFCDKMRNMTSLARDTFWNNVRGKTFTWTGNVVNVKGRSGKYEIYAKNPSCPDYRGFNLILVSYTTDASVPSLKIGQSIKFTGELYNYRVKSDGAVIAYLKNVVLK